MEQVLDIDDMAADATGSEFIRVKEVAHIFNVSIGCVHKWIDAGVLRAGRIGGTVLIVREDVEQKRKELLGITESKKQAVS